MLTYTAFRPGCNSPPRFRAMTEKLAWFAASGVTSTDPQSGADTDPQSGADWVTSTPTTAILTSAAVPAGSAVFRDSRPVMVTGWPTCAATSGPVNAKSRKVTSANP